MKCNFLGVTLSFEIQRIIMASNITAMAQQQPFNPWSLPDSFTVYAFAPEEIRSFLHPHWQTQKAPHPMIYYLFGILYLVIGEFNY